MSLGGGGEEKGGKGRARACLYAKHVFRTTAIRLPQSLLYSILSRKPFRLDNDVILNKKESVLHFVYIYIYDQGGLFF
jgi:hypothetical protein